MPKKKRKTKTDKDHEAAWEHLDAILKQMVEEFAENIFKNGHTIGEIDEMTWNFVQQVRKLEKDAEKGRLALGEKKK